MDERYKIPLDRILCDDPGMQKGIEVRLGQGDRERLEARGRSQQRAKACVAAAFILATAEGCGTVEVMRRAGGSKASVWRWQHRFMAAGVEGLLRDKTRKPGKAPVPTRGPAADRPHARRAAGRDDA